MRRSWIKSALAQLWLPVVLVVILWIWTAGSSNFYFPPLKTMLGALWTGLTEGELRSDLIYSVKNILAGLAIAVVVGVLVGLVIGERERLRQATQPVLDFARATPTIAFVPVIILSFGIGAAPKIFLIFLGSVWPILLNTVSGVAAINPAVHETARSYCIPWRLRLFKVTLPGALPQIFAGIRVALQVAIVLMVVSEIYGSPIGLGNFILQSGSSFRVADTWAGTILIGVLGYALNVVFLLFERSLLAWHFQQAPRTRRRSRTSATAGLSPAE